MARSAGSASILHSIQASRGMMMNCAISPMSMSLGWSSTGLKSEGLRVSPMPNMTIPSMGVMADGLIHVKDCGMDRLMAVTASTTSVMCAAIHAENLYADFMMLCLNALLALFGYRTLFTA